MFPKFTKHALQRISDSLEDSVAVREDDHVLDGIYTLDGGEPGKVYRGMTQVEYEATIGGGNPIQSTGDYSVQEEGTCFAYEASDAESYINFGRDNPLKTGVPTFLVEVEETEDFYKDTDGYPKCREEVSLDNVTGIWIFEPGEENPEQLVMKRIG